MKQKELKLPEIQESAFESVQSIDWDWRMDPPYLLRHIKIDELINIAKIRYETLAKVTSLRSQILQEEVNMYSKTAKILAQKRDMK